MGDYEIYIGIGIGILISAIISGLLLIAKGTGKKPNKAHLIPISPNLEFVEIKSKRNESYEALKSLIGEGMEIKNGRIYATILHSDKRLVQGLKSPRSSNLTANFDVCDAIAFILPEYYSSVNRKL